MSGPDDLYSSGEPDPGRPTRRTRAAAAPAETPSAEISDPSGGVPPPPRPAAGGRPLPTSRRRGKPEPPPPASPADIKTVADMLRDSVRMAELATGIDPAPDNLLTGWSMSTAATFAALGWLEPGSPYFALVISSAAMTTHYYMSYRRLAAARAEAKASEDKAAGMPWTAAEGH